MLYRRRTIRDKLSEASRAKVKILGVVLTWSAAISLWVAFFLLFFNPFDYVQPIPMD